MHQGITINLSQNRIRHPSPSSLGPSSLAWQETHSLRETRDSPTCQQQQKSPIISCKVDGEMHRVLACQPKKEQWFSTSTEEDQWFSSPTPAACNELPSRCKQLLRLYPERMNHSLKGDFQSLTAYTGVTDTRNFYQKFLPVERRFVGVAASVIVILLERIAKWFLLFAAQTKAN